MEQTAGAKVVVGDRPEALPCKSFHGLTAFPDVVYRTVLSGVEVST